MNRDSTHYRAYWNTYHMKRLDDLMKFYGGGGSSAAQQIQSAPVPTPAPPVTASSAEVIQAEHDLAQQNLMKKSVKKTIFAGDSGGYQLNTNAGGDGSKATPTSYKSRLG